MFKNLSINALLAVSLAVAVCTVSGTVRAGGPKEQDERRRLDELKHVMAEKLDQIEMQLQKLKADKNAEPDPIKTQVLDQARASLMKQLIDLDIQQAVGGFAQPGENRPDKNQPPQNQMPRLHVKLANGNELDADGPWLMQMPEVTREILEQFADPIKDGALAFRFPDQLDNETVKQLHQIIVNTAPNSAIQYVEKARLMTVTSDDLVQLRRVAGIVKALKSFNNPGPGMNQKGLPQNWIDDMKMQPKFKGDPNGKGPPNEGAKFPPRPPDAENVKKQNDTVKDNF